MRFVITSISWGSNDSRQLLVLAALAAVTAACATDAASVAVTVAATITSQVCLAGPSIDAGVGVRCFDRNRIAAVSLGAGVGVCTFGAGCATIAGRATIADYTAVVGCAAGVDRAPLPFVPTLAPTLELVPVLLSLIAFFAL